MQERNAQNNAGLPPPLLRPTPRHVRLNANGVAVAVIAVALVVGGLWAGNEIYRHATVSGRHAALFHTESVATDAEVVRLQRRDNGRRWTIHYQYADGDTAYSGEVTLRQQGLDRVHPVGSRLPVRYLRSEPHESWIEGSVPEPRPVWPAIAVPAASITAAMCLVFLIRRQSHLLTYGRPAPAFVTRVEKKRSDKGTFWRVHYEWTLLSGAKRTGHYKHGKKQPPAIGTRIPIVYDRDQPSHHSKYPLSLVHVGR